MQKYEKTDDFSHGHARECQDDSDCRIDRTRKAWKQGNGTCDRQDDGRKPFSRHHLYRGDETRHGIGCGG